LEANVKHKVWHDSGGRLVRIVFSPQPILLYYIII
jgi:hypothetical protein